MKQATNDKLAVISRCLTLFTFFCLFLIGTCHARSGWVSNTGPGSWDSWVKKAHANHPALAKKVDEIVAQLNALHDEVKAARCRTCNNAAGTLSNAKTEAEQVYYALGGRKSFSKNKVKGVFKSFNNYENRMKWRFPQTPIGQAWFKRWTEIKNAFNAIEPEILKVVN